MGKILLIHPDLGVTNKLSFILQHSGFQVASATEGQEGLTEIYRSQPGVIIMAESMNRLNGDELCLRIRGATNVPVIVLGDDEREWAGVYFLESGADVYMTRPLNLRLLLAWVRSLLRRTEGLDMALRSD
jgi:DNA-binding response OmpR family regulator